MTNIDAFLDRNQSFASADGYKGAPIYPSGEICIVTCLDPRTDPANFFDFAPGEAAVIRNAGGRVTDAVIDDLALITYLSETRLKPDAPLFEVAVIHHNKCGTSFLANEDFRHGFATQVGIHDEAALAAEAVTDPEQSVRHDVERLRSSAALSRRISVSGHVYDVDTGLLTTVLAAAPMPAC